MLEGENHNPRTNMYFTYTTACSASDCDILMTGEADRPGISGSIISEIFCDFTKYACLSKESSVQILSN